MKTSLQGIGNRAKESKKYRFQNLYTMLNELNFADTWKNMNRQSSPGIDKITVKKYEQGFAGRISNLVKRLKRGGYRAELVKRVYIPKSNGKMRGLGIPSTEDKLVQATSARILGAIYEQDFLPCSYGYRPDIGPLNAVKDLDKELQFGRYRYIVEADIKGFFDNIDHDWLLKMLEERVNDKSFIRLIKKWLKAGVFDEGKILHPVTGSPQGGVISPLLSNIYLHYVLDIWFEKVVKNHCEKKAYLCRFADDFVCAFESKADADRFYKALYSRMAKFGLSLAEEKTRIIKFNPFYEKRTSFDFLGFEFYWGKSKSGKLWLQRRTSRSKFRASLKNLTQWCKGNRSLKLRVFFVRLNIKLLGYYNYYGVVGNYKSLTEFYYQSKRIIYKWLNRRSYRRSFNWKTFTEILAHYAIQEPRITERKDSQLNFTFL